MNIAKQGMPTTMCIRLALLLTLAAVCCHADDPSPCQITIDDPFNHLTCSDISDFSVVTARLAAEVTPVKYLALINSPDLVLKREDFANPAYEIIKRFDFLESNLTSFTSEPILGLHQLTYLHLESNSLTSINDNTLTGLTELDTINLSRNKIETISDGAFNGLNNVTFIDLSHNKLTSIHNGIFNGLNILIFLNLGGNSIATIDENSFSGLEALYGLALHENNITQISLLTFQSNPNLTLLDLSDNDLSSLDSQLFASNPELVGITLEGNDLENLSNFHIPATVKRLNLANSNIHQIPDGYFHHLTKLENLDISSNKLREISTDLLPQSPLRDVKLDGNGLTSLSVATFAQFHRIIEQHSNENITVLLRGGNLVNFKYNPWNCSTSDMVELRAETENYPYKFDDIFDCDGWKELSE